MDATGPRIVRLAGALLIIEGSAWFILRFLTLTYFVASEAYQSDETHQPIGVFALWLLVSVALFTVALIAGLGLRRDAERRWPLAASLAVCAVVNAIVLASSVLGIVHERPFSVESTVAWAIIAGTATVILAGIGRFAVPAHARDAAA
jgi:heme/copper-type cytochrome/quinol oxidase subunit 3